MMQRNGRRMTNGLRAVLVLLALLAGMALFQPDAAAGVPEGRGCDRAAYTGAGYEQSSAYFLSRCIRDRTSLTGETLIRSLQSVISPILGTVSTLAIILLGIRVTLAASPNNNNSRLMSDSIILGIKICLVNAMLAANGQWLIEYMHYFMDGVTGFVVIVFDGAAKRLQEINPAFSPCTIAGAPDITGAATPDIGLPEVFYRFDCLFRRLLGEAVSIQNVTTVGLAVLMAGVLFSWPLAVGIFLFALMMLFLYFAAILQALLYTVSVYLGMALLFGIAPIVLPMFLFGVTRSIAIVWLNNVIGYTVLPAIITAFLMMMQLVFLGPASQLFGPDGVYGQLESATGQSDLLATMFSAKTEYSHGKASSAVQAKLQEQGEEHTRAVDGMTPAQAAEELSHHEHMRAATTVRDPSGQIVNVEEKESEWEIGKIGQTIREKAWQAVSSNFIVIHVIKPTTKLLFQYYAVVIANIILLSLMLAYQRKLIADVHYMIDKGSMGIVAPNRTTVEKAGNVVGSAISGASRMLRW